MPLPRGVLTIGRARGNDLELRDPDVSRQHASVTVTAGGLSLRDLDSTNGTLLDEQLVDPDGSPLEPGQMVRVGDSLLCVSATDEPAAATRVDRASAARIVNRAPRLGRGVGRRPVGSGRDPAADVPGHSSGAVAERSVAGDSRRRPCPGDPQHDVPCVCGARSTRPARHGCGRPAALATASTPGSDELPITTCRGRRPAAPGACR